MNVEIIQQRAKCIGCNACVEIADYRWRISKRDGKCTLVGGTDNKGFYRLIVMHDEWHDAQKAASVCPVKIIQVKQIK